MANWNEISETFKAAGASEALVADLKAGRIDPKDIETSPVGRGGSATGGNYAVVSEEAARNLRTAWIGIDGRWQGIVAPAICQRVMEALGRR